jgi:mycoredoxin
MSDVTSANVNDLQTFLDGGLTYGVQFVLDNSSGRSTFSYVSAGCPGDEGYFAPQNSPGLDLLEAINERWQENQRWVRAIREELIAADTLDGNGNATIPDTVIETALTAAGLADSPDPVAVAGIELAGEPPNSGFVDDPICLANGNFFLPEVDGKAWGIQVEDPVGCPVFAARLVSGFDASAPTPAWMRKRLEQAGIAYDEVNIERDPEAAAYVESVNGGNQTVPTIRFADGTALTNPPFAAVAEKVADLAA